MWVGFDIVGIVVDFGGIIQIFNRRKGLIYMGFLPYSPPLRHRSVRALLTHTAPTDKSDT